MTTVRRYSHYDDDVIERGLLVLAMSRSAPEAVRTLDAQGIAVPKTTLLKWARETHAERYTAIRESIVPQIHARLAVQAEDSARQAMEVQAQAITATGEQIRDGALKDASTAARNLATAAGIMVDKAALMRNKPTAIIEHRDASEIARSLAALRPDVFEIDIADVEVVEPEQIGAPDDA